MTGFSAASGATISASDIALSNIGGGGMAVLANGATVNLSNVSISWSNGSGAASVEALGAGLVQLSNTTINIPSGTVPTVLLANGAGSRIIASDFLTVQVGTMTSRTKSFGFNAVATAQNGGTIQIPDGGNITALQGGGNAGFVATDTGSAITANDVNLTIGSGGGDAGVAAGSGAEITMTGGSVNVVAGVGGLLQNGGTVTMTGTDVTTSGSGGVGFLFNNGGSASTLNYSNGTITTSDASFSVQSSAASINLDNATATTNNNTLLATSSGGSTTFNAQSSTLQGVITTDASSTANVNLTAGTTWTMTGNSNATNVVNNDSLIDYTPPVNSVFKTLTTTNYSGTGGAIGLNTFLGTDGSPSDLLVIDGGTGTGSTTLRITNAGGAGAMTTSNGILVVQAANAATTTADAFTLGGAEVRAGAFNYYLFRGGIDGNDPQSWYLRSSFIIPPNPTPITPTVPTLPPAGITPTVPTVPPGNFVPAEPLPPGLLPPGYEITPGAPPPITTLPVDPPPGPPGEPGEAGALPPGTYPIIGPEIATDGAVQPVAREMGQTSLATLHDRNSDAFDDIAGAPCPSASEEKRRRADTSILTQRNIDDCLAQAWRPTAWIRIFGDSVNNTYRAFADPGVSGRFLGVEAGLDLWRGTFIPGHRDAAGLYFSYVNADMDVDGLVTNAAATGYVREHTGALDLDGYSVGAYWTHYGPTGWYLDGIAQATRYDGTAGTQNAVLKTRGYGVIASLEAGYPFAIPELGPGFVLEPQAQILWQHVEFDEANDGLGDVALGATNGASGRIGGRARWALRGAGGEIWQPFLKADLWRDFGADVTTVYSGVDEVPLEEKATRLDLGGGLRVRLDPAFSVFATGGYQFALGGTDGGERRDIRGTAGLRYSW